MSFSLFFRRYRFALVVLFSISFFLLYLILSIASLHFFHPGLPVLCVLSRYLQSSTSTFTNGIGIGIDITAPLVSDFCPSIVVNTRHDGSEETIVRMITAKTLRYNQEIVVDQDDAFGDDIEKVNVNEDSGAAVAAAADDDDDDDDDDRRRRLVESAFIRNFEEGLEVGAQLTVYKNSKKIIDIAGATLYHRNKNHTQDTFIQKMFATAQTENYSNSSLQRVFSCTKVLESLAVAILVDRGLLSPSLSERVSSIWPEFVPIATDDNDNDDDDDRELRRAIDEKSRITVKEVMQHEAGLCFFTNGPMQMEAIKQYTRGFPQLLEEHVRNAIPHWDPTSRKCYHAFTRGFVLGPIISRVDPHHRLIHTFIQDEILRPLRLLGVDYFLSMPPVDDNDHDAHRDRSASSDVGAVDPRARIQSLVVFPWWSTLWNVMLPLLTERVIDTLMSKWSSTTTTTTTTTPTIGKRVAASVWTSHKYLHDELRNLLDRLLQPNSFFIKSVHTLSFADAFGTPRVFNNPETYNIAFSSASGMANGAALARISSLFVNNGTAVIEGFGSVSLVNGSTLSSLMSCDLKSPEILDVALGYHGRLTTIGLGCNLYTQIGTVQLTQLQGGLSGWRGMGGSMLLFNERTGIAIGYAMNRMGTNLREDRRSNRLFKAIEMAYGSNHKNRKTP